LSDNFNKEFGWPKKDIPLLFIHCEGEEKVILSSKSKYNEDEANIVVLFLEKLIKCGIDMKDIGVITPYVAQIDKIKSLLIEKNIPNYFNLKIASVDSFQGGEKKFIILSNVRSNKENNIGFLQDYRRLNVSITRAIYGMVIIGNAKCLYKEQTVWRNFITSFLLFYQNFLVNYLFNF
jgi:regulator of nonsense transcripts 1